VREGLGGNALEVLNHILLRGSQCLRSGSEIGAIRSMKHQSSDRQTLFSPVSSTRAERTCMTLLKTTSMKPAKFNNSHLLLNIAQK
jgi:hypothetical protein